MKVMKIIISNYRWKCIKITKRNTILDKISIMLSFVFSNDLDIITNNRSADWKII